MKKIYTIAAAMVLAFAANAQRTVGTATPMQPIPHSSVSVQSMPITDTLAADADWSQQPTLYSSSGGGYVVGTNGYGDLQKVQIYRPGVPVTVIGAIYWFGAKQVGANNNVAMRIYHLDGTMGTSTAGTSNQVCPNTTYVSDNVQLSAVDTSLSLASAYVHTYSAAQFCAGDFAVGFSVAALGAGDTLGLVSTADPNSNTEDSWEEWSDNSWHTMLEPNNWGLNIAFAIFPLVDAASGINNAAYINDIKVGLAGPNPTMDNTTLAYELRNNVSNVTITVLDAQGRIVSTESNDNVAAGQHMYNFNGSSLPAGTYYIQFNGGANNHIAVPVVKQ